MVESLERELPDLPDRRGWEWDERRAARVADTGRPDDPRRRRSGVASVSAASLDAPPIARSSGPSVQVSRWPHIPTEEREVAEIIAASVQRSRNGEPASVLHEERLSEDVSTAIDRAIAVAADPAGCRSQSSRNSLGMPVIGRPPNEMLSFSARTSIRCRF